MLYYKRKTILLSILNVAIIAGFIANPQEISGNPLIILIAIGFNIYGLLINKEKLPKPYLFTRYLFILLFIVGIILSVINN